LWHVLGGFTGEFCLSHLYPAISLSCQLQWIGVAENRLPNPMAFIGKIIIIFPIDIEWPSSEFTPLGQKFLPITHHLIARQRQSLDGSAPGRARQSLGQEVRPPMKPIGSEGPFYEEKKIDFPLLKKGGAKPPTPGTTQSMPHCSPFVQLRGTAIPVLTVMTVGSKEVMGRVPKVAREVGHAVPAQSQSSMVLANHPTSIHPAPSKIQREQLRRIWPMACTTLSVIQG